MYDHHRKLTVKTSSKSMLTSVCCTYTWTRILRQSSAHTLWIITCGARVSSRLFLTVSVQQKYGLLIVAHVLHERTRLNVPLAGALRMPLRVGTWVARNKRCWLHCSRNIAGPVLVAITHSLLRLLKTVHITSRARLIILAQESCNGLWQ